MRRWGPFIPLVLAYWTIAISTPVLMLAWFGVGPRPTALFVMALPLSAGHALLPQLARMLREN